MSIIKVHTTPAKHGIYVNHKRVQQLDTIYYPGYMLFISTIKHTYKWNYWVWFILTVVLDVKKVLSSLSDTNKFDYPLKLSATTSTCLRGADMSNSIIESFFWIMKNVIYYESK